MAELEFTKFLAKNGVNNGKILLKLYPGGQGREIRIPVPGPPRNFDGEKITGTNDFAFSVEPKSTVARVRLQTRFALIALIAWQY